MTPGNIEDRLSKVLPGVVKPARYTGGELNSVVKDHAVCDMHFALAFPDTYELGMSNLAISILYTLVNSREDSVAERVFAPWPDMEKAMRERSIPLFTLETKRPVCEYDIVGFSLSYEMCYTNVLNMLDLAGIPVSSLDRDEGEWPIIIAGGHCVCNPEPMAPFIDLFVLGEGEDVLHEILDAWKSSRHLPRIELLANLARLPGVYVPRFYDPVYEETSVPGYLPPGGYEGADLRRLAAVRPNRDDVPRTIARRRIDDVNSLPFPANPIVPYIEVVHDRISLEVMRGCTRGCRFCQAGMITRPVREKSPDILLKQAEELVKATGHEDISLVSLSTADHSKVEEIVTRLIEKYADRKIGVSLPSLRADKDCVRLVEQIQRVRKTGLTFAPEAGTQRLRDVINKNVTEEDLFQAVETAFSSGWQRLKLYFMISLPTETDEDVVGIADLAMRVGKLARRCGVRNPSINVGISSFAPKPHTPFQWHGQDSVEEIERKQRLIKQNVRDKAIQLRWNDPRSTHLEAVLALGDRRLANAIEAAWRDGHGFDAWTEYFNYSRWMNAFRATGIDPFFVANREKGKDETFAWDHMDCGVSKGYLKAESKRAEDGVLTGDCHTGECTFCRACERYAARRMNGQTADE